MSRYVDENGFPYGDCENKPTMTDNEIIKALECCAGDVTCDDCPMVNECSAHQTKNTLASFALSLIKRQKAEIERLEKDRKENFEMWKKLCEQAEEKHEKMFQEAKATIRPKAIKEFAYRLKQIPNKSVSKREIDEIMQEMVGDGDG